MVPNSAQISISPLIQITIDETIVPSNTSLLIGTPLLYSADLSFQQAQQLAIIDLQNRLFFSQDDDRGIAIPLIPSPMNEGVAAFYPSCMFCSIAVVTRGL